MINKHILQVLQAPDGTELDENLLSRSGKQYEISDGGVLMLDDGIDRPMDVVYKHPQFELWEKALDDRLTYYTTKKTVAGRMAHLSHTGLKKFNARKESQILVDIGCGDGSELERVKDHSTYIGIDRNLKRLEILKKRFPEATAIYADASKLPFKKSSIDFIYSSNAFEHLWYLKEVALECNRCLTDDGEMKVIVPTEGGLWNFGRNLTSKPHFQKKYPEIDFELISHIEHCNQANQINRTLETFFNVKRTFVPFRIPTIYLNVLVEMNCKKTEQSKFFAS